MVMKYSSSDPEAATLHSCQHFLTYSKGEDVQVVIVIILNVQLKRSDIFLALFHSKPSTHSHEKPQNWENQFDSGYSKFKLREYIIYIFVE